MKLFKLAALSVAVIASTSALAAETYQYDSNKGVVSNTASAVTNTGKTLFETATHPAAVSAEIGTLGYGANIAWGINQSTELQAGWSGMNFDGDEDLDANDSWLNYEKVLGDGYGSFKGDFEYDFDFSNPYIGVQMRPFANNFTVAGGVIVPSNEIKASIESDTGPQEVTIDGTAYQVTEATFEAENKNKLAPYATIGYRPNINQNWGFYGEIGAAYMGELEAKVDAVASPGFEEAAKKEMEEDDFWYPIVKAGVTYRF